MQPVGQSVTTTYGSSASAGGFGSSNSFGGGGFGNTSSPSDFGSSSRPATGKAAKFADPNPDSVFDRG